MIRGSARGARIELRLVVAHPVWIFALALLLLNDHLLKGAGVLPGWVTGKLSDLAGLFVAPALLAVLFRASTRRGVGLAHVATGVGFAALELSRDLTAAADAVYRAAGYRWQSWSDPTDLFALFVLPAAYLFASRTGEAGVLPSRGVRARLLTILGLVGCLASSGGSTVVEPEGLPLAPDCAESDSESPIPGCPEADGERSCDNGWDDDGDGATDCDDDECADLCAELILTCESAPYVELDQQSTVMGSTLGKSSLTESDCIGADAPDTFIRLGAPSKGTLTMDVPLNHGVSVRVECSDWRAELGCFDAAGPVSVAIPQQGVYTLVVEAADALVASDFIIPISFEPD